MAGQDSARRRATERLAYSASTLFAVAIVVMVNYLAFRNYERFDWTGQGMYTLSPKSVQVMRELDSNVDIYLFMSRSENNFGDTDELLKRYQAASTHILVHYVDPDREAAEFKLLSQRFGIGSGRLETGEAVADVAAVVTRGDKNWHVGRDEFVAWDYGGTGGKDQEQMSIKAEQALTGAVVQVTSGRSTKICVTEGHGERSLDDAAERSVASLKEGLRHDNIEWQSLQTLGKDSVPKDCDAVLVLGPARAFGAAEVALLKDYLEGGGNALLALDPVIELDQIKASGFEEMALGFGIRIDSSLVIELNPERLRTPNTVEFLVTEFGDHVTTRPLRNRATIYTALARSIVPTGSNESTEILLRTSPQGFGKVNVADVMGDDEPKKAPGDVAGPVSLSVAANVNYDPEKPVLNAKGGRLVVVGDSDWLEGVLLEAPDLANFHLASAWVGWLSEREALIEIPPKKVSSGNIVFTQDDLWALFFRVAILLPGAALLFGVAMWLNRRS